MRYDGLASIAIDLTLAQCHTSVFEEQWFHVQRIFSCLGGLYTSLYKVALIEKKTSISVFCHCHMPAIMSLIVHVPISVY